MPLDDVSLTLAFHEQPERTFNVALLDNSFEICFKNFDGIRFKIEKKKKKKLRRERKPSNAKSTPSNVFRTGAVFVH